MYFLVMGAFLTSLLVCALIGPFVVKAMRQWLCDQSVRDCGPKAHLKKNGTPTMGGIIIILAILIASLLWCPMSPKLAAGLWLVVAYGLIGFIDDAIKIVRKRNLGLTSKQKLLLQLVAAIVFLLRPGDITPGSSLIWIPIINQVIDLGVGYYVFAILLIVGATNAVNLTDGLDGLASLVTVPVALSFAAIAYLERDLATGNLAMTIAAACLGFLIFNHYPAKIFMGDTGSLALGGGIAALALLTHTELLLILIGGVYVAEALSVIIQVAYFKHTGGKRIFRMSPLHHHFELGGMREPVVVLRFSIASFVFSLLGAVLFVLR